MKNLAIKKLVTKNLSIARAFNFSSAIDYAFSLFIFFFCSCQIKDLKRTPRALPFSKPQMRLRKSRASPINS